MILNFASRLAN